LCQGIFKSFNDNNSEDITKELVLNLDPKNLNNQPFTFKNQIRDSIGIF